MSQLSAAEQPALGYATPAAPGRGPRVWACLILMLGGLGLVLLGGCFMIGIMILNETTAHSGMSMEQATLQAILYVIALACFGGAIWLLVLAVKWLRRVVFS